LALRKQIGEKQLASETQVALARVSIEEGHAADAEKTAREYKQQFHQDQQADDELRASGILVESLLAQVKVSDAQQEAASASSLAAKSQNLLFRIEFQLASARALLAGEHPREARPQIERALHDARAHGLIGAELEARLALAELAKKTQQNAVAQSQLSSLEESARARGFGLILRHATAMRN